MLRKMSYAVAGMALTLAASTLAAIPTMAQDVEDVVDNKLIPMSAHTWAEEVMELEPEAVAIARVRGKAGDVLSLQMMYPEVVEIDDREYTHMNVVSPSWDVKGGDDVIVAYIEDEEGNGKWMYIGKANYATYNWITRLDLKAVPKVDKVSIEWEESKPVALPPQQPSTAVVPAPAPAPITGLW